MIAASGSAGTSALGAIIWLAIVVVSIALYWTPSFIAYRRRVPGLGQVVIVNLFLGWTFLGWIVALVMAFREAKPRALPRHAETEVSVVDDLARLQDVPRIAPPWATGAGPEMDPRD